MNPKQPSWAKLIRPRRPTSDSGDQLEAFLRKEEEAYVRKRCFHILSQQMRRAKQEVLQDALASCLDRLGDYLDAACPSNDLRPASFMSRTGPPLRKRHRLSSKTTETTTSSQPVLPGINLQLFDEQQEDDIPHDPLLLPIIVLEGPAFGLDRKDQMEELMKSLQMTQKQSAVVKVERSSRRHFHYMQELVQQCHQLFPVLSSEPLRRRIINRKKKKACTYSDMLLLWAQHVTCYDEIVVFLNADENLYNSELQDFLHVVAAMRAEHGIPLCVVMLGPPEGRRNLELRSTWQGYAGFVIRSLALPSTEKILDQFWNKLWIQQKFPVMFPPIVLCSMRASFAFHHQSANRCLAKFDQALAYYFAQPGSFLSVTNCPSILSELWQRISWFFVDENARDILFGDTESSASSTALLQALDEIDTRQQRAQLVLELFSLIQQKSKKKDNQPNLFYPSFTSSLCGLTRRDLLEMLYQLRHRLDSLERDKSKSSEADYQAFLIKYVKCVPLETAQAHFSRCRKEQIAKKRSLLNEMIVLVGNCRDGENLSEMEQLLDEVLAIWIYQQRPESDDAILKLNRSVVQYQWDWTGDPPEYNWASISDSLASQPRKHIVKELLQNTSDSENQQDTSHEISLAYVGSTIYRLIHDKVAIPQEDWYEEFWQQITLRHGMDCTREKSFELFSLGLRYLKQCGLIVEKLRVGSKSDIIYERAKLVWCSG